jgi:transposase
MQAVEMKFPRCCGLDVHKRTVVAAIRIVDSNANLHEEVRTFATTTCGLLELGDWLVELDVDKAAMESTGVYWKPVWNLLEGRSTRSGKRLELMLVNARHVRNVPGRKTDVRDCQWIAQLLSGGLLSPSFVPPRPQRELRDLTRQRAQLIGDRSRAANRLQKVLEDANIKLASVASDVLGVSGRQMLRAIIQDTMDAAQMAELAKRKLRLKIPQLVEALSGRVTDHHRFMLGSALDQIEHLESEIKRFDQRIEQVMGPFEQEAVRRLDQIPGFDRRAAQNVLAEIGTDMSRFPTAGHLGRWAGMAPGNNQSAGRRRSGRMTEGNRWLKRTLNQTAWAASRSKTSYFRSQHARLARRRGAKRATMAVGHSQLCTIYHMLQRGTAYADLGVDYFDHRNVQHERERLISRLQRLGCKVTVESVAA